MTGGLYLLNALWIGAALVIGGRMLPSIARILWKVIVLCLPFGLVAGFHLAKDIARATRQEMERDHTGRGAHQNEMSDGVKPKKK